MSCVLAALTPVSFAQDETGDPLYNSFGRRDPFVPLVGDVGGASAGGAEGVFSIDDVVLQGIVLGRGGKYSVIINGDIVAEGDKLGNLKVEKITDNTVTFLIGEEKFELKLYEQ